MGRAILPFDAAQANPAIAVLDRILKGTKSSEPDAAGRAMAVEALASLRPAPAASCPSSRPIFSKGLIEITTPIDVTILPNTQLQGAVPAALSDAI
jgi:hypothetical protein